MLNSRLNLADLNSVERSRINLGLANVSLQASNAVRFHAAAATPLTPDVFSMTGMYPGEMLAFDGALDRAPMPSWANAHVGDIDVGGFGNDSARFVREDELAPIAFSGDIADGVGATEGGSAWWKISHVIEKLERPHMRRDMSGLDPHGATECRANLGVHPLQTFDAIPPMASLATHGLYWSEPVAQDAALSIRPGTSDLEWVPLQHLLTSTNGFVRVDGAHVPYLSETRTLFDEAATRIAAKLEHYEATARTYEALLRSNAHTYVTRSGHLNDVDDPQALRDRLQIGSLSTLSRPIDDVRWTSGTLRANALVAPWLAVKQHGGTRSDSERFDTQLVALVNGTLSNLPNTIHPEASADASQLGRVRVRYRLQHSDYPIENPPAADLTDAPSYPSLYSRGTDVVIRVRNIYKNVVDNPLALSGEFESILANNAMAEVLLRHNNLRDLVDNPSFDRAAVDATLKLHPVAYSASFLSLHGRPKALSDLTNDVGLEPASNAFAALSHFMREQLLALLEVRSLAFRDARQDDAFVAGDAMRSAFVSVRDRIRVARADDAGNLITDFVGCKRDTGRFERIPRASVENNIVGTVRLGNSLLSTKGVATVAMLRHMEEEVLVRCKSIARAIKAAYAIRGLDPFEVVSASRHHHLDG